MPQGLYVDGNVHCRRTAKLIVKVLLGVITSRYHSLRLVIVIHVQRKIGRGLYEQNNILYYKRQFRCEFVLKIFNVLFSQLKILTINFEMKFLVKVLIKSQHFYFISRGVLYGLYSGYSYTVEE